MERFKIFKCFSCKIRSLLVESDWTIRFVFFIAHNFRLSTLTGNEHIFQEKHLKILKRSTHTWPQLNTVPLIPGPLYARCSTHIWTPILLMFHSYCDPISINVPLMSGPHHTKCSIHTWPPLNNVPLIPGSLYARCSTHIWTPIILMFHLYLDPILQNVPLISGPHLDKCSTHVWTPSYKMFHSYLDPPYMTKWDTPIWDPPMGAPIQSVLRLASFLLS